MTDASMPENAVKTSIHTLDARTKKRNAAEARFKAYGIAAIAAGLMMLVVLVTTIVGNGFGAFQQTFITLDVELVEKKLDKKGNRDIADIKKVSTFGYAPLLKTAFETKVEELGIETDLKSKSMSALLSKSAPAQMRDFVLEDVSRIGQTVEFTFLANSRIDGYLKGRVTRESIANDKNVSVEQLDFVDQMVEAGVIEKRFNIDFIIGADASDQRPEAAGIGVAMAGSFFMMLVVL